MKHLPNLLTLANLFCGCIAIVCILNSQPLLFNTDNGIEWHFSGPVQPYLGSLFIGIAAIFDMLDGAAARALKVYSPIGKDLDSLADMVTFGVAPSMILYKMLWGSYMSEPDAMDDSMFTLITVGPAFLLACFAALRLAKFNTQSDTQKWSFSGMPSPAVGLFVASFPLLIWFNPLNIGHYIQNKWALYLVIAILCWLMVSGIQFFKLMPRKWNMAGAWRQLVLLLAGIGSIPFIKVAAIPFVFILYVVLSILSPNGNKEEAGTSPN